MMQHPTKLKGQKVGDRMKEAIRALQQHCIRYIKLYLLYLHDALDGKIAAEAPAMAAAACKTIYL